MNAHDERFAARMASLREAARISQASLADALKDRGLSFHQQTVAKIERGNRSVSIGEAALIAETLGTDLGTLMEPDRWGRTATQAARVAELENAVRGAQQFLNGVS